MCNKHEYNNTNILSVLHLHNTNVSAGICLQLYNVHAYNAVTYSSKTVGVHYAIFIMYLHMCELGFSVRIYRNAT